ncbi:hypothetical protein RB979_003740 [Vibrio alginolyticus]|uniref:DUF6037 family protein n=1 Tax=Vibrionaceae TaxID=641 RepID=UPI001BD645AC|nr:DUF6037 family protein [Vibrio alginolyticus]ELA6781486.1 hypothetical protein [Vibrio alginolyticus]MBS9931021.1 hypothetical protein [Vibrio alginolyticus]
MKLDGIIPLYKSMKTEGIDRYRFDYKSGKAVFDVFFFIDSSPYILLFGVKAENFSFELEVKNGFVIGTNLDNDTYKELCRILGLEYDPNRPFSTWNFFNEFNGKIPQQAIKNNVVSPQDIAPYQSVAEEADKIYFVGWRDNSKWGTNVQPVNLDKTRKLLGEKAYIRCKQKNISSCWSDKNDSAVDVKLPQ